MSEKIVEVRNLTKQYGKQKALDDVTFSIKKGSIVGLIGPNGAGKTTIMKTLGGLVYPTSGEIEMYGATDEKGLNHARTRMSFMIEAPYEKEKMTARENLEKQRLQKGIPDKKRIDEVLKQVNLENTGKKIVKNFSLGMRQRLGLANALLAKPELLILDEPINGLDPEGIVEIRELFRRLNKEENITLVISSHILSELSLLCTDYVFINNGKIKGVFTEDELKAECSEYIQINTDNNEKASAILIDKIGIEKMDVTKESGIRIYEKLDEIRYISKTLYENGIIPVEIAKNEVSLEDYYMKMVSGV
ncbi:MAG: ATP-binding cassette domain-containing protein [Lachnospiraceae bacterium]|jgi:ABC-2 type transport system ATP-binding protein|nr:ATP-binding cassette domain-containing protein [Lachnospiraceae bacterium]MBQ4275500.1 ATP-binding cassette domain-containing protein [Lachnospiraceae bacterium]MCR4696023.1 ATP-binding cassette domain-containing protein [Lachnospiraceae bacterium]